MNIPEKTVTPTVPMPVKAKPYTHQVEAFNLACRLFGLTAADASETMGKFADAYCENPRKVAAKSKYHGGAP